MASITTENCDAPPTLKVLLAWHTLHQLNFTGNAKMCPWHGTSSYPGKPSSREKVFRKKKKKNREKWTGLRWFNKVKIMVVG